MRYDTGHSAPMLPTIVSAYLEAVDTGRSAPAPFEAQPRARGRWADRVRVALGAGGVAMLAVSVLIL